MTGVLHVRAVYSQGAVKRVRKGNDEFLLTRSRTEQAIERTDGSVSFQAKITNRLPKSLHSDLDEKIRETRKIHEKFAGTKNIPTDKHAHPDGTTHGRTAILIRDRINHREKEKYDEDYLQTTSIEVSKLGNNLTISAIYCPPKHNNTKDKYSAFLSTLGQSHNKHDNNKKKPKQLNLTNKRTNWDLFRKELEARIALNVRLKTPDDIDNVIETFTKAIQHAAWVATPNITHVTAGNNYSLKTIAKAKKTNTKGYNLVTAGIFKEIRKSKKPTMAIVHIFNPIIRKRYFPTPWKVAEIIMLLKPGKPDNQLSSYRPISLLPIMAKLLEKLILKRLKPIIDKKKLYPNNQFEFRAKHAPINQVHRETDHIEKYFEEKKICSVVFLDRSLIKCGIKT
ncbi:Probable RNA-directed DNA polymerase from transposon X-element [Anthophora plagiata]